jgi:hypothetical protein
MARGVVGAVLLIIGLLVGGVLGVILGLVGVIGLVTGLTGFCPIYKVINFKTN